MKKLRIVFVLLAFFAASAGVFATEFAFTTQVDGGACQTVFKNQ